jgi:hypothetical protein
MFHAKMRQSGGPRYGGGAVPPEANRQKEKEAKL